MSSAKRMKVTLDPHVYAALDLETGESFLIAPDGMSPGPDFHERSRLVRRPAGSLLATFFADEQGKSKG